MADEPRPGQIALPFASGPSGNIVIGTSNEAVIRACETPGEWPFGTALLWGPPRSGKSLTARWFEAAGHGEAIDDAETCGEADLFHRWNRAQQSGTPLLIVGRPVPGDWQVRLPDLASRLGAALNLAIQPPDDAMLAALIMSHGAARGVALGEAATDYLVPRCERSFAGVEALVARIDRLSLEKKTAPGLAIWREALSAAQPPEQPRLL